jgi:hypothetical protein
MSIITDLELKELEHQLTEENAGIIAVHLEYLVRIHPKFKTWATLPHMAAMCSRMKRKKEFVFSEIDVIRFTLKQRKTYRI